MLCRTTGSRWFYIIYCLIYYVEPPRSGQSRPNSIRISEFHLVSHAKPDKRTVMRAYMAVGPIPYRAAFGTLFLEDECVLLVDIRRN